MPSTEQASAIRSQGFAGGRELRLSSRLNYRGDKVYAVEFSSPERNEEFTRLHHSAYGAVVDFEQAAQEATSACRWCAEQHPGGPEYCGRS